MKMLAVSCVILLLGLVLQGCAQFDHEDLGARNQACVDAVDQSPEAKLAYSRVLRGGETVNEKKLNDVGHLSKLEKDAFLTVEAKKEPCRRVVLDNSAKHSPWQTASLTALFEKHDKLAAELLRDRITVGQYNKKFVDIRSEYANDVSRIGPSAAREEEAARQQALRDQERQSNRNPSETSNPYKMPYESDDPYGDRIRARIAHPESTPTNPLGTAFLRRSYVTGQSRICIYKRSGEEIHTTVKSYELCPQTLD